MFGKLPPWLLRWRPFRVYRIAIEPTTFSNHGVDQRFSIRWGTRDDLASLSDLSTSECIGCWDGSSQRVAIAFFDELPVGVAWIASDTFAERELGLEIRLADAQAWLYAAHVHREYRRRGVYRSLLLYVISRLRDEGKQQLLLGATFANQPSILAHEQQGAIAIGSVVAARFLGLCFATSSGDIKRQTLPMGTSTRLHCPIT